MSLNSCRCSRFPERQCFIYADLLIGRYRFMGRIAVIRSAMLTLPHPAATAKNNYTLIIYAIFSNYGNIQCCCHEKFQCFHPACSGFLGITRASVVIRGNGPQAVYLSSPNIIVNTRHVWLYECADRVMRNQWKLRSDGGDCGVKKWKGYGGVWQSMEFCWCFLIFCLSWRCFDI